MVAGVRFERRRCKHQQGQPAILHTGQVLDRLANQRGWPEVVMLGEQALEGILLIPENRANHDVTKLDGRMFMWRVVWQAQDYARHDKKKLAYLDFLLLLMTLPCKMK